MTTALNTWLRVRSLARANSAYLASLAMLTAVVFLWRPRLVMPRGGTDPSWFLAMNQIVVDKLKLGDQVIFTFGPLSRLYSSQYHPELFLVHCLVAALLSLLYVWLLHRVVSVSVGNLAVRLCLVLLLALFTSVSDVFWYSFAPLGLLAVLVHWRPQDGILEAFFWLGMAILALIKSSYGISAGLLWAIEIACCIATRKLRLPLLAFPAACLAIWMGAGQSPLSLPRFARYTLEIASGYGEAMGRPLHSLSLIWGYWLTLGSSAALLFLATPEHVRVRVRWRAVPALSYLILSWSLFKGGFIGGYVETATVGALLMASCVWVACWRDLHRPSSRALLAFSVLAGVGNVHNMSTLYHGQNALAFLSTQANETAQRVADNFEQLRAGDREQDYAAALTKIRRRTRLPPLQGSVDVYRTNQSLAFAYAMNWNPRLAFQSYAAYTPALIEQNRLHLTGPTSPDHIVMDLGTTDNRYPMLDDGISLLEILSRYRLSSLPKNSSIFSKRAQPNRYRFEHEQTIAAKFDTPVSVPGQERKLLWAWLSFEKTGAGKLATVLYRAPIVDFEVQFATGKRQHFRMVPSMSGSGFLLSPWVNDVAVFGFLNDASAPPPPASAQVVGFQLHVEQGFEWVYRREISVKFAEVSFDELDHNENFDPAYVAAVTGRRWTRPPRRPR